eukprot:PhF_6_TR20517/c0_g1_i4/m.29594
MECQECHVPISTLFSWKYECTKCHQYMCSQCCPRHVPSALPPTHTSKAKNNIVSNIFSSAKNSSLSRSKLRICSRCRANDNDPVRILPTDAVILIFTFISIQMIPTLQRVRRLWYSTIAEESLWDIMLNRDFPNYQFRVQAGHTVLYDERTQRHETVRSFSNRRSIDVYQMLKTNLYLPLRFSDRVWYQQLGLVLGGLLISPLLVLYYVPDIITYVRDFTSQLVQDFWSNSRSTLWHSIVWIASHLFRWLLAAFEFLGQRVVWVTKQTYHVIRKMFVEMNKVILDRSSLLWKWFLIPITYIGKTCCRFVYLHCVKPSYNFGTGTLPKFMNDYLIQPLTQRIIIPSYNFVTKTLPQLIRDYIIRPTVDFCLKCVRFVYHRIIRPGYQFGTDTIPKFVENYIIRPTVDFCLKCVRFVYHRIMCPTYHFGTTTVPKFVENYIIRPTVDFCLKCVRFVY